MLIKCPQCNHGVLSVASRCPQCGYLFTARRFQQGQQRGTLTECRRCGGKVASEAATCPYCRLRHPGRHWAQRTGPVLSVIAVLGVVGVGVWLMTWDRPTPVTTADEVIPALLPLPVVPAPSLAPTEAPPPTVALMETRWTSTWVNVREGPAIDAPILQILRPRQRVEVADRQGRWWLVYLNGERLGYIANSVLQATPPDR